MPAMMKLQNCLEQDDNGGWLISFLSGWKNIVKG